MISRVKARLMSLSAAWLHLQMRFLLTVIFVFIFIPVGILRKIFLRQKIETNGSYFVKRVSTIEPDDFDRPY